MKRYQGHRIWLALGPVLLLLVGFQNCQQMAMQNVHSQGTVFDGLTQLMQVDPTEPAMNPLAQANSSQCVTASGKCSLNAALQAAQNSGAQVIVQMPDGLYNVTSNLTIPGNVTAIVGSGANGAVIDGTGGSGGLFTGTSGGGPLAMENLTLQNATSTAATVGAAFTSPGEEITITNSSVVNHSGPVAIYVSGAGNFVMLDSTVSQNSGTGIAIVDTTSFLIENSTFASNGGAGVSFVGDPQTYPYLLTMNGVTMSNNSAENISVVSIANANVAMVVSNSILAETTAPNCSATPGLNLIVQYSVISDNSCGTLGAGNVIASPLLLPLANNGGTTQTMLPAPGSPAIGLGQFTCLGNDQRNQIRPAAPTSCDAGSVQQ